MKDSSVSYLKCSGAILHFLRPPTSTSPALKLVKVRFYTTYMIYRCAFKDKDKSLDIFFSYEVLFITMHIVYAWLQQ